MGRIDENGDRIPEDPPQPETPPATGLPTPLNPAPMSDEQPTTPGNPAPESNREEQSDFGSPAQGPGAEEEAGGILPDPNSELPPTFFPTVDQAKANLREIQDVGEINFALRGLADRALRNDNEIKNIWQSLDDRPGDDSVPSGIRFGYVTASWTTGNTVVVTPCKTATDPTPTGQADVTLYIDTPITADPQKIVLTINDIVAFQAYDYDANKGQLFPALVKFDVDTVLRNDVVTFAMPATFSNGSLTGSGSVSITGACSNGTMSFTGSVSITVGGALTGVATTKNVITSWNTTRVLSAPSAWNT